MCFKHVQNEFRMLGGGSIIAKIPLTSDSFGDQQKATKKQIEKGQQTNNTRLYIVYIYILLGKTLAIMNVQDHIQNKINSVISYRSV